MALYIKQVLIRQNSSITFEGAKAWTIDWITRVFQNKDENKDENGNFIDYFAADVFDSRTGDIARVFTDAAKSYYHMSTQEFLLLSPRNYVKIDEIVPDINSIDLSNPAERKAAIEDSIFARIGKVQIVEETHTVENDKITTEHIILGKVSQGVVYVDLGGGVVDEVPVSVTPSTTVTLAVDNPGEYDGKQATVYYLALVKT
jgi:hypothetical protein